MILMANCSFMLTATGTQLLPAMLQLPVQFISYIKSGNLELLGFLLRKADTDTVYLVGRPHTDKKTHSQQVSM